MSHQDWKIVTFNKPQSKVSTSSKIASQLPSKKEFILSNKELPLALQQARTIKGLKQTNLALKLNLSSQDINAWERGVKLPSNDIIAKLSRELGIKLPRNIKILKENVD